MTEPRAHLILTTNPRKPYKPGQQRRLQHTGPIRINTVYGHYSRRPSQ